MCCHGRTVSRPKEPRISVRIPKNSDLGERLRAALKKTRLDEPTLVLQAVEATIEYIEKHGEITLPIAVRPKKKIEQERAA
jgi:hypothetical protein